jgi:AraC family transcriptional regulator, transcriptional activator of the genes for pyochelin and ferripyochelin receptors
MEFKIIVPGLNGPNTIDALPPSFDGTLPLFTTVTSTQCDFGQLCFRRYEGDGFDMWYNTYQIIRDTTIVGYTDVPMLKLRIHFLNPTQADLNYSGDAVVMPQQYSLAYTPVTKTKFESNKTYEIFDIRFKIAYLEKLSADFPILDEFLSIVGNGQPAQISKYDRFLSPAMIQVAQSILNCPYRSQSVTFIIEAKIVELLLLVLQECSVENPLGATRLTEFDKEMLSAVKVYLENHFDRPCTLKELSKRFTINEYKLKKGFKFQFGSTVFDFLNSVRMNKAHSLLRETQLTINEIATLTGFEDRTSFDKAFKKHFSYTAAYLRRHKAHCP